MKKELLVTHNLAVGFQEELISAINNGILQGDRIGIIGSNGSGKTTLLRTLAGLEESLAGSVMSKGKILYVSQIHTADLFRSGGQQSIAILTEAFGKNPDVLLLDEPTNHLDVHAKQSLIRMIQSFKGAVVCISHDVWFLEQITNKLWIIVDSRIRSFTGTYTEYKQELERNEESRMRKLEVVAKEQRKLSESLKRESARSARSEKTGKAQKTDRSTARGAQGFFKEQSEKAAAKTKKRFDRIKEKIGEQADSLKVAKKKKVSGSIVTASEGASLFHVRDADLLVQGRRIVSRLSLDMDKGDRIAIVGRNGSGKSALIKALLGHEDFVLEPKPYVSPSIRIEYLDQHYTIVDPEKTVLDNSVDFSGTDPERVRQHLSHFLFGDNDLVARKAKTLSGGMTARLAFVMLTVSPIDLLILDEPTNNLDMETVDDIVGLLGEYEGGLLVISHDIDFLERIKVQRVVMMSEHSKIITIDETYSVHDII